MNNNELNESNLEMPTVSLDYYKSTNDVSVLLSTFERLENKSRTDNEEELYTIIKNRINYLNNIDIQKTVNEEKDNNNILANIEVLKIIESMNDKDNYGFRNDMNIIKLSSGNNMLYEVPKENLLKVEALLKSSKNFKTEQELLDKLKPYLLEMKGTKLDLNNIDINKELDNKYNVEEIKSIRQNSDRVYMERNILKQYIYKRGLSNIEVKTVSNSRGERLYLLGSTVIKFLGENLDMYILNGKGNEKISTNNYNKDLNKKDNKTIVINNINEYSGYINVLETITNKIYSRIELSKEEEMFFEKFIKLYIESYRDVEVYAPLVSIYDTFYGSDCYVNDNINIMINAERSKEMEEREKSKENNSLSLKLENKDYNNGFVNIIYIIATIIVSISIILYLFLVNK